MSFPLPRRWRIGLGGCGVGVGILLLFAAIWAPPHVVALLGPDRAEAAVVSLILVVAGTFLLVLLGIAVGTTAVLLRRDGDDAPSARSTRSS